ncbi:TRAP transporter substrate-binding protein [Lacisediminimonas sp.]|uniref:TRAP transporter substrate-binding protein n=1 Tax=Lacisediminimonas sp. TaxID=3060582 RepID=UPI002715BB8C|nr:TRAP transporter substrate-binding protein [Lacisediminimonas sp.]MDO8300086.1 TRAP transporter substrate-binding protein [Lacisediminimonas sp.]
MTPLFKSLMVAASLLFTLPVAQAQTSLNVLVGNATANDTQAANNDKFAELMTTYSGGRIKASARHGESLGTNAQMFGALQAGSLHGMILPAGFVSSIVPELSAFDMPFLLPGAPDKMTAFAAQSTAAKAMMAQAEKKGIHVLGFHGIGPQSFLTRFPITKLEDISGKKFRVIPSPPRVGAYQDWSAVARPMELGEVYTSLQQGTLDGMENPPDVIFKMKLHEAAKYYTITGHFAFMSIMMVSKRWYDGLPKDLQAAVTKAAADTIKFADVANVKNQQDSLDALKKAAVVTVMPPAELQKMKDLAQKGVWQRMKSDPVRGPIIKLLEEDVVRFNKAGQK